MNITEIFESGVQLKLEDLEKECLKIDQVECPVIHHFGDNLYIREVRIPKGTFAIGHKQKQSQMNVMIKGIIAVLNDDGTITKVHAPKIYIGNPGRKCGFILEDMIWLNVYSTNETDVEKLEEMYLDKSLGWEEANMKQLEDFADFHNLLSEFGVTEVTVRTQTENEQDQIPMPNGSYKFSTSKSMIEGIGIFATSPILCEEVIGPARIGGKRTPIGRFTNHSKVPNAKMIEINGDIFLVAISNINGCKAGFLGDEITTNYRDNLKLIGVKPCQE